eukprot:comp20647_c1_seq1/m.26757 comp20647_c1_seq1/g.26757  ORF comp20647_c1_seq1/g.26757 comp20647_c1_seq1/m.26757 type:complete len:542 (-) comp20647_c1_seq1:881-2506(-)
MAPPTGKRRVKEENESENVEARIGPKKAKTKPAEDKEAGPMAKYSRGAPVSAKGVTDKKLKAQIKRNEKKVQYAVAQAAKWELLLPEQQGFLEAEGMEKTYKFTQKQLSDNVDVQTSKKIFNLDLDKFGPYRLNYDRAGRYLLIGGKKGHVAMFDWKTGTLGCELHLGEMVRDVQFLHNETMFAVAQKKYTYIYDRTGAELHCMKQHLEPTRLAYLPYHFLLVTTGLTGQIKWHDTSTGQIVAEYRSKLGSCDVMTPNPYNAIMMMGHHNGTVTMWTPNMSQPVVKMLCHKGPVRALAVDHSGRYMATSGLDGQMKIWDVRTYKEMHAYYTPSPAACLDISQGGLLAVGYGPHVQVWKDAFTTKQQSPYMSHLLPGKTIDDFMFVPYEDVLGIGHSKGMASIVVPGAGEANFDTLEVNPYATKKQRQEKEVKQLLEKIPSTMITLDPDFIGRVDRAPKEVLDEERKKAFEANNPGASYEEAVSNKARGRNTAAKRYLRKQKNIVDQRKMEIRERLAKEAKEKEELNGPKRRSALDRFHARD